METILLSWKFETNQIDCLTVHELFLMLSFGVTSLDMESLLSRIYTIILIVGSCDFPDLVLVSCR